MRKTYETGSLDEQDIAGDPMVQFEKWFQTARSLEVPDWLEVNAMTLATSGDGPPTARIVLLKGHHQSDAGPVWTFYSNYRSTKAKQIEANPSVSLCFYWPHTQQQIRILGTAAKSDRQKTIKYFQSRPRESQLGAVVSDQSSVIESRDSLQSRWDELRKRYEDKSVPCPDDWGGYDVTGHQIEFWQGRPGRLHDRLQYRRNENKWVIQRLAP